MYCRASWYSCLKPKVVRSPEQIDDVRLELVDLARSRARAGSARSTAPRSAGRRGARSGTRACDVAMQPSLRCSAAPVEGPSESRGTVHPCGRNPTGSRPTAARSRRGSPTGSSSSAPGSSTGTGSRGSTSRPRSCSSATREGRVTRAFTPDFFLPEEDLYIEVTVMKQSLVTRKNRKLRELREQYPRRQRQALLPARSRAPRPAIPTEARLIGHDPAGEVYLSAAEIAARVARARRRDRRRLRRPRAAARRAAEVERRLPRRPLARAADPARDRSDRARGLRRRRRAAASGC